jgi:hypothetical protein
MDDERQRLAATFDRAADLYQRARPEYPSELYGEIRRRLGSRPDGRLHRHSGGVLHIARRRTA